MLDFKHFKALGLGEICEKVLAGQRLTADDGLALFQCSDLTAVGALAHHVRTGLHNNQVTYVVNRQVNYTNVCVNGCTFCAFRRDEENQPGAFTLSHNDIFNRIDKCMSQIQLDELHMVGGCHPQLPLSWFEELLSGVREKYPALPIKAFTPVEIAHFAQKENISTKEVLKRLQNAGLRMMPGGGAEIFNASVRRELCPHKADSATWLRICGEAHELGIKTNCTMLFGHVENYEHRVEHLIALREQQDKSGGFTCFIALPFLKANSRLRLPPERQKPGDGLDKLRTIAVSRLLLDNIPHIKAYWVMLGVKLAQTALFYGADDLDGTVVEEHIGHMAGAQSSQGQTLAELEAMIRDSGFVPVRRNAIFEGAVNG